ncbi:tetratricopeptide repeat protein [Gloeobacter kilaueensis]|uniref:Serine/threonine protein kinase n=1 Tax=Gloeobacter kilaueensis (strain ATCC BAA-2537 / CCAP 1431/1 / ULC 316 / JS1) TaxID=1183438 RepID=U5QNR5_GLOK1|nr:serine/threonine-protein kinase [Gloeobacter kilaueensis]AGY60576.1 serine/threonine protein kinase [Gloeobacter kilaueensis JS1]
MTTDSESLPGFAIGQQVGGRYRLTRWLDGGSMGGVFEAADTRLANKVVAIKVLHQGLVGDTQVVKMLRQRFEEEARLSAILGNHSRIIQVTDYGLEANQPYLVMEFLGNSPRSRSLKDVIAQGPLAAERVVRLATQICDGLQHAHTIETTIDQRRITGIVHRDIKPSNIFLIADEALGETVKILDFGVAKAKSDINLALGTHMGFVGTSTYASPEQMRGEELDARSDIYSLGVVLYQMLTGQLPFQPRTNTFPGWYQAHNYDEPIPFDTLPQPVPTALQAVVLACLAKNREDRPASMQVLSDQLQAALKTATRRSTTVLRTVPAGVRANRAPTEAMPAVASSRLVPWRWPAVLPRDLLIGTTIALVAIGGFWYLSQPTPPASRAAASVGPYIKRGVSRFNRGDYNGAVRDLGQAIAIEPDSVEARYNRGLARYQLGDYQGAVEDFTAGSRLEPDDARFYTERERAHLKLRDFGGVTGDLSELIRLYPKSAAYRDQRGLAYVELKDYGRAIADFSDAIALEPKADYFFHRSRAYQNQGNPQKAKEDFDRGRAAVATH